MRILHSRVSDDVHVVRNVNIKAKLDLKTVHIRTPALHAFFHTQETLIFMYVDIILNRLFIPHRGCQWYMQY